MEKLHRILLIGVLWMVLVSTFVFGFGNKEVPDIPPVTSGTQYISPNGDGVKDSAVLTFSVKIYVKSKEGYVPEYGVQILDGSGKILKEVKETEKSDIGWFASIFQGYKEFTLKREISWDGTDLEGKRVSDGTYGVKLFVVDSSKNRKETDVDNFVVDTVKPSAAIVLPENMIFSPNGDGNLDSFLINFTKATKEELWKGTVLDAEGNIVRTYKWENSVPGPVEWDGKNDAGVLVTPGTYSFSLESTDKAGNSSDPIIADGIILDNTETKVAVVVENPWFSPNGDGIKDTTKIYFDEGVKTGITSWLWNIVDMDGKIYLEGNGVDSPPEEITLDGKDSSGQPMPEGLYRVNWIVGYKNGNRPSASESFSIDVSTPKIDVTLDSPVFSPDGDGKKDVSVIQLKSNEIVTWQGSVLSTDGETILTKTSKQTTSLIVWDGSDKDGKRVKDGEYVLTASFTDRAGNTTEIPPKTIRVDTKPVKVVLGAGKGFSPNGDNKNDFETFVVDASQYDGVDAWTLEIFSESGEKVKTLSGKDFLPKTIEWDGLKSDGSTTAEEGNYTAKLTSWFTKGVSAKEESNSFVLDTTPPSVTLDTAADPFAETDSGIEGDVYVTLNVKDNMSVSTWAMDLLSLDGKILRSYSGEGDPSGSITWNVAASDGKSREAAGKTSEFILKLTVTDPGDNSTVYEKKVSVDILLVMKNGRKYISVPNIIFGAYKYALDSAGKVFLERNNGSLDKVAGIYKKYPDYGLILEGHALDIYLNTPRQEREEKILLPLTQHRAETVKKALVSRGMKENSISIEAYGGLYPVASVTDRSVWWKNRRVEFVMVTPGEGKQ